MALETFRTLKGIRSVVIKDLDDSDRLLVLPSASEASFNPGATQLEVVTSGPTGEMVVAQRYVSERKPTVNVTFGVTFHPELLGMSFGQKFVRGNRDTAIEQSNFLVPASKVLNAATAGLEGYGIIEDEPSKMSYYVDSLSVNLTQGTYASFDSAATPLGFAIGANGAIKFGDGLVGKYVSWSIPVTLVNILYMSQLPFQNFSATMIGIGTDNSIQRWHFPSVTPDVTAEKPLNQPTLNVPFFVNFAGGCSLLDIEFLGQIASC